jgi:hypothetical protein
MEHRFDAVNFISGMSSHTAFTQSSFIIDSSTPGAITQHTPGMPITPSGGPSSLSTALGPKRRAKNFGCFVCRVRKKVSCTRCSPKLSWDFHRIFAACRGVTGRPPLAIVQLAYVSTFSACVAMGNAFHLSTAYVNCLVARSRLTALR